MVIGRDCGVYKMLICAWIFSWMDFADSGARVVVEHRSKRVPSTLLRSDRWIVTVKPDLNGFVPKFDDFALHLHRNCPRVVSVQGVRETLPYEHLHLLVKLGSLYQQSVFWKHVNRPNTFVQVCADEVGYTKYLKLKRESYFDHHWSR